MQIKLFVFVFFVLSHANEKVCKCDLSLVESIPQHMKLTSVHVKTSHTWLKLLSQAQHSIQIASFYWTLTQGSIDLGGMEGKNVFNALVNACKRGVNVEIIQSIPKNQDERNETDVLSSLGASVQYVYFPTFFGSGVQHAKFMVVDGRHFYLGSANMDWRSLTQVKELGIVGNECECISQELVSMFYIYSFLNQTTSLPSDWPLEWQAHANLTHPFWIESPKTGHAFVASSPQPLCSLHRSWDLEALLNVIRMAQEHIYISVMDYIPATIYTTSEYWPVIDDALRDAVFSRGVHVRLLISEWEHSKQGFTYFLQSLERLGQVCVLGSGFCTGTLEIRLFKVPKDPVGDAPFTRVNHAKYMCSESTAFIHTSNWTKDYFYYTGGSAFVTSVESVVEPLKSLFLRDWNSPYAFALNTK